MNMNAKQAGSSKNFQDEAALNKVLCWIAGGSVLEFLLLLLNRYYNHYTVSQIELRIALGVSVKVIAIAALVLAVGAWFWRRASIANGKSGAFLGMLTLFLLGVSISCFATWFMGGSALRMMYVAVPVIIIIALIYYLYQREFFLIACLSGIGLFGIWLSAKALGGSYAMVSYVYLALAAVVAVGGVIFCRKLQAGDGVLEFKGRQIQFFFSNANYVLLYVTVILNLAVLIACVLSVPSMLLIGVLVAWLLIMAVYYTIKQM